MANEHFGVLTTAASDVAGVLASSAGNEPRRILHFASGDVPGGAESVVLALSAAQKKSSNLVFALLLNDGHLAEALRSAGIDVWIAPESKHGFVELRRIVGRVLVQIQPDIVHAHRYKEVMLAACAQFGQGKAALVRTVHGAAEPARGAARIRRCVTSALETWIGRRYFEAIVYVSAEMLDAAREISSRAPLFYVPNGIAMPGTAQPGATPRRRSWGGMRAIVSCGRLVPVKRIDVFVDMARHLSAHRNDVAFKIIGDGPLRSAIEQSVKGSLANRVDLLGFRNDVASLLAQSEILVVTSDAEGMPIVVLEAMAAGAVVVARAVGAIPELLGHGVAGILIEGDDSADYARAVSRVLDDAAYAETLRTAATLRLQAHYTSDAMRREYDAVYSYAVAAHAAARRARGLCA